MNINKTLQQKVNDLLSQISVDNKVRFGSKSQKGIKSVFESTYEQVSYIVQHGLQFTFTMTEAVVARYYAIFLARCR